MGVIKPTVRSNLGGLEMVLAHGNTGATETVDLGAGNVHTATLDTNCTFTFSGAVSGLESGFTLVLTQDGTGSRTVTWPGSVAWPGASAPTLATAAGAVDVFVFMTEDGGTNWRGFHVTRSVLSNPMTTAEDIIVGGASGVLARKAKGAAGAALSIINSGVAWNSGTSMPTGATGDRYWRTDAESGMEFRYDGTRWKSEKMWLPMPTADNTVPQTATGTSHRVCLPIGGTGFRVEDFFVSFLVLNGTALDASNKWVLTLKNGVTAATLATVNINTGSVNAWRSSGLVSVATSVATTEFELEVLATKTGTPGNLYMTPMLTGYVLQT